MNVLLLCGYFEPKYQEEIGKKTKTWIENAANTFQERLITGFLRQDIHLSIVSAPLFGAWPTAYSDIIFRGFEAGKSDMGIEYVSFNNIWGYRNISRTISLKKSVDAFLDGSKDTVKAVIIYGAHTPYMAAAAYAKQICPEVHINLILPDMPQFMNISKNRSIIYDFCKKYDVKEIYRLNRSIDSYMLLTKYMVEAFEVGDRPYIVAEGISDASLFAEQKTKGGKTIAYAGKLEEKFGVQRLIDAFSQLKDAEARLVICGGGELADHVKNAENNDSRIVYKGLVPAEEARSILQNADVLVTPRLNNSEYTKYSFPSKNIEYLQTGNTVVGYMLDGVPEEYSDFMITPNSDSIEDLKNALIEAINSTEEERNRRFTKAKKYICEHCDMNSIAKRIIFMITEGMPK